MFREETVLSKSQYCLIESEFVSCPLSDMHTFSKSTSPTKFLDHLFLISDSLIHTGLTPLWQAAQHMYCKYNGPQMFVPWKRFWIIALLSLYSMVSRVFRLPASISITVNTTDWNGNSWEGRRLTYFWHWRSKHIFFFFLFFFWPTAQITIRLLGKIGANLPVAQRLFSCR